MSDLWLTVRLEDGEMPTAQLKSVGRFRIPEAGPDDDDSTAVATIDVDLPTEVVELLQAVIEAGREAAAEEGRRAAIRAEARALPNL